MSDLYAEVEFSPRNPVIFGRWNVWVRTGSGFPLDLTTRWTEAGAQRAGRRLLQKHRDARRVKYRLDELEGGAR